MQARLAKLAGSRNYRAKLTELMQGYIDYALERPHVFDFVFSRERPGARKYPEDFQARRSPTLNVLADTLMDGMQAGALAKADVWELALQFWALVHGYVALYRAGRFELSPKAFRELCDRSIERLFDGLCK
jgi:AcrR family transcriptional regulator